MVWNDYVGIVLNSEMIAVWREAGEVWEAVSLIILCSRLKLAGQGVWRSLDRKRDRPIYVSMESEYAPMFILSGTERAVL